VVLESFWAVGWTLAALIGFLVVPRGENGWRWALVLGAVPALYAVVVRLRLPESVRFLESKGRHDEAEAVVRRFEDSAGGRRGAEAAPAPDEAAETVRAGSTSRVGRLWSRPLRRRTAALWAVWFCVNFSYYGAFIWLPSLLYASGFSLVRSFGYTLLITLAQLPGYAVAAVLVEVWGRRSTLVAALVGSAAAAALFANADSTAAVLTAGMLLSFFNLGAWGALYAVTPELYPTSARGTGAGWAAGVGRIASVVAPLSVPLLIGAGGTGLVFAVFAGVFLLAALAATALPELRGRALAEG
jgi:putative MFS transporter